MKMKSSLPAEVAALRQRLEKWRQTNGRRHLPEPIWEAATRLASTYGISAVSLALRLSYHRLKKRLVSGPSSPKPAFVEVALPSTVCASECTIELKDRAGSSMSIRLGSGSSGQLVVLAQSLWRSRR